MHWKEIQRVVSANDTVDFLETLPIVFHNEEITEPETFTGVDKSNLRGFQGLAFPIRKSLKYYFTENNLRLCLNIKLNYIDYSIGFLIYHVKNPGTGMLIFPMKSKNTDFILRIRRVILC